MKDKKVKIKDDVIIKNLAVIIIIFTVGVLFGYIGAYFDGIIGIGTQKLNKTYLDGYMNGTQDAFIQLNNVWLRDLSNYGVTNQVVIYEQVPYIMECRLKGETK